MRWVRHRTCACLYYICINVAANVRFPHTSLHSKPPRSTQNAPPHLNNSTPLHAGCFPLPLFAAIPTQIRSGKIKSFPPSPHHSLPIITIAGRQFVPRTCSNGSLNVGSHLLPVPPGGLSVNSVFLRRRATAGSDGRNRWAVQGRKRTQKVHSAKLPYFVSAKRRCGRVGRAIITICNWAKFTLTSVLSLRFSFPKSAILRNFVYLCVSNTAPHRLIFSTF